MMHKPPHPGEILRADYLEPLQLSVTEAAAAFAVAEAVLMREGVRHSARRRDQARGARCHSLRSALLQLGVVQCG
jgi:hypothetical protein